MGRDVDDKVARAATEAAMDNAANEVVAIMEACMATYDQPRHNLDDEQKDYLAQLADSRARTMLRDLTSALGSQGFARVKGVIEKVNCGKKNVIVQVAVGFEEDLHLLTDILGAKITIVHSQVDALNDVPPEAKEPDPQLDLLNQVGAQIEADGDGEPEDTED